MYQAAVHVFTEACDIVLAYGLQGVVILSLAYCCRNLFTKYCDVQEKRIIEAQAQTTALNANTAALDRMADAIAPSSNR